MTRDKDRSSADIERDVEWQRAEMAETLDALKGRMTPGGIFDEAWEFARDSGSGDFVRNLGTSVRDNPLPIALIGAGIAWLMSGRGGGVPRLSRGDDSSEEDIYDYRRYQGSRRRFTAASLYEDDEGDPAYRTPYTEEDSYDVDSLGGGDQESQAGETLTGKARRLGSRARDATLIAGEDAADAASRAAGAVGDAAGYVGERASAFGRDATRRTRRLGDRAWRSGRRAQSRALDFIEEQPLAFALAGLALGAVIGASIRSTSAERELMGEASDRMKEEAKGMARRGFEQTVDTAERTYDAMRDEAEAQGLTPGDATDAADDIAERVRHVAEKGREKLAEEVGAGDSRSRSTDSAGF